MEIFFFLLFLAIVVMLIFALTGNEPSDGRLQIEGSPARITLEEASQINRVATLSMLDPTLARTLVTDLEGDAWQIAQSSLCTSLLDEGDQEALLQLLARLDEHHRGVALLNLLTHLIDQGNAPRALELLAATGDDLPAEPLPRIALLHASGRLAEASAALAELERDTDTLAPLQLPKLAREQRRLAQHEAALRSLDLAWRRMQESAATQGYLGIDDLFRELAELGEFQRLQEIGAQLPTERRSPAITELTGAGRFDQALALLEGLPSYQRNAFHEQVFAAMLEREQLPRALELLATVDDLAHRDLLMQLAQWHIDRGTFATSEATVQALARNPHERIDLYLSLGALNAPRHPDLAARLLDDADRWVSELPDDEQGQLRFFVFDARLTIQSRLPERERVSYEVRRGLEQMERLLSRMDRHDRIANLERLAGLLQKLGRREDALRKLEQARDLLRHSTAQDDLDDFDKALLLAAIANRYLQLDRLDLAQACRADIPEAEAGYDEHEWIGALISHGHLEQAIHDMRFIHLHDTTQPLARLRTRIDELAEQGQALRAQLLDRLRSEAFWGAPA